MKAITTSSSPIITGTLATLGLVLLGSLLTSLLLQFSQISELSVPYFSYAINALSVLAGGWIAGKKGGHKGWYFGGLTGVAYFALIVLTGFLAFDVAPHWNTLLYLLGSFLTGALGGVFGVNMSGK